MTSENYCVFVGYDELKLQGGAGVSSELKPLLVAGGELLTCPWCNKLPKTDQHYPDGFIGCKNSKCPICDVPMKAEHWNTRDGMGSN